MSQPNRSTFLTLGEFLEQTRDQCLEAQRAAEAQAERCSDPVNLAWGKIAAGEARLAATIEHFLANAPSGLQATRVQYVPQDVGLPSSGTPEAIADAVLKMNHAMTEGLDQLSTTLSAESTAELLSTLQTELEAVGRQISVTRITMRDGGA